MVGGAARLVEEEEELEGARRGEEAEVRGGPWRTEDLCD
jgi:hypothetical protein